VAENLSRWRKRIQLQTPLDLFNDRVDYKCESFDDVKRINDSMSNILEKFSFLDPKRAKTELGKFMHNFELLQTSLVEVEEVMHVNVSPQSRLQYYQSELDEVNARIANVYANGDIGVMAMWASPSTSHTLTNNNTMAAIISGQSGCVLSSVGISKGIKVWKLRMVSRTSTCMIGVATQNVSKTSTNYSSNGFFCNLDGGTLYSGPPMSYSSRTYMSGVTSGQTITLTLNCDLHTLHFSIDGRDCGLAYENLPAVKLFLAFDNNTTGGSTAEFI